MATYNLCYGEILRLGYTSLRMTNVILHRTELGSPFGGAVGEAD